MNSPPEAISVRDRYAQKILETYHERVGVPGPGPALPHTQRGDGVADQLKVGIIGAGAAGLYTAMILKDLGIAYEILEADSKVGGRLFTYEFSSVPNDYYDVGAMRFPDNPVMHRTFDLFKRLKFDSKIQIEYIMSNPNDVELFNGYLVTGTSAGDPFHVSVSNGGTVPDSFVAEGYETLIEAKLSPFREALVKDFEKGWKLLQDNDGYSMRTYMSLVSPKYPDSVIDWCETMGTGTGLFDFALSEAVMESLAFSYPTTPEKPIKWFCIQGGAQTIANKMRDSLGPEPSIRYRKRVTSISPFITPPFIPPPPPPCHPPSHSSPCHSPPPPPPPPPCHSPPPSPPPVTPPPLIPPTMPLRISVVVDGETTPREYSHVITTISLSCLRMVDTDECNLSYALKTALRELHYDASVKVAIKFTDRWWEPEHKGGVSRTDRPTRVVVYPSYGIDGGAATMICSYTWSQDALRLGALVHGRDSLTEQLLIGLILHDLAAMHGIPYETLNQKVVDYHAWNWYASEFSCGAFAYFGPGQFSNIYKEVTKPAAGGLLHFAGEATSVNHAWIVGALDSAYRCVLQILIHEKRMDLIAELKKRWGTVDELREDLVEKQVLLGRTLSAPRYNRQ